MIPSSPLCGPNPPPKLSNLPVPKLRLQCDKGILGSVGTAGQQIQEPVCIAAVLQVVVAVQVTVVAAVLQPEA